jgi:type IV pilus assembly protein PilQ
MRSRLFLFLFAFATSGQNLRAQDLKEELDALDEVPEDDLSELAGEAESPDAAVEEDVGDLESALDGETPAKDQQAASSDQGETAAEPDSAEEGMTGVDISEAAKLSGLDFRQLPDRVRLILRADTKIDYTREIRRKRRQVILELKNTTIARTVLKRAIDTGEFDGPVALVQAYEANLANLPGTKVLIQLRQPSDPVISRSQNNILVDFMLGGEGRLFKSGVSRTQIDVPETFIAIDENAKYIGSRISLNVKDAELSDVINLISKVSGKNFVLASTGQGGGGKVTMNVRNVPWDQVLAIVLFNNKLGYQKVGDVYRINPASELNAELQASIANAQAVRTLAPLETRIVPLSYARATEVLTNIGDFKTERGKISVDARTNSLVVTDISEAVEKIRQYVESVDKQTTQILIEARIVEATQDFNRTIGLNWTLGQYTAGQFDSGIFAVNNEAIPPPAQLGFRYNLTDNLDAIDALLNLTETQSTTRTLASPRVTVLDNRTAKISQTDRYPYQVATEDGITTQFADVPIELSVTPSATSDGFVLMKVNVKRGSAVQTGSTSAPVVNERQADTELLVESGKTAVIGGLFKEDTSETEVGIPWLKGLPVLGPLFRASKISTANMNELMIFISPRIVNPDRAFLANQASELDELESGASRVATNSASSGMGGGEEEDVMLEEAPAKPEAGGATGTEEYEDLPSDI